MTASDQESMQAEIASRLRLLEGSQMIHNTLARQVTAQVLRATDMLALMVLKRSSALVSGFGQLLISENFTSAVPLIRLQVDNLLRFKAASLAPNPHMFVWEILQGTPINQLHDINKQQMSDRHLRRTFASEYPWLNDVYERTSGFVHLSEQHFTYLYNFERGQSGEFGARLYVGPKDPFVPPAGYKNALDTMLQATDAVLAGIERYLQQRPLGLPMADG